MGFFIDDLGR
jgi:hypothetical protein